MDYEKKYKQALERAEEIIRYYKERNRGDEISIEDLETVFPELAESEDEKIRNALIRFHKSTIDIDGIKGADIIAWLEKQGINYSLVEEIKKRKDSFMREKEKAMSSNDKLSLGARIAMLEELLVFVKEKQGERKSSNVDYFQVDDEVGNLNDWVITTSHDKVEPKFKVGDWIACSELNTAKIISFDSDRYEVEFIDGSKGLPHIDYVDSHFNLWTIADAKDGDVIFDKSDGTIGIFQSIGHHPDGGSYNDHSYCFLHCRYDDGYFFADFEDGNIMSSYDVVPATKEQRDTLERAMTNAGYRWDKEKLKLEKI